MPQEPLPECHFIDERELHNLPREKKPTIKILLYTDDPSEVVPGSDSPFGLGQMIAHLVGHAPAFANLCVRWESRYPAGVARPVNRINDIFKKEKEDKRQPFDQIWFFGLHQVNKASFSLGIGGGGQDSELDKREVDELRTWMDAGGGVLMTGDHANRRPQDALPLSPDAPCPDEHREERYLGLGRALGRCVPRAGQLRDWEGNPTAHPRNSYNTQVVTFGTNVDTEIGFQRDEVPQQLILQTFNEKGRPTLGGRPHPLFFYKGDHVIQVFPDHLHEGAVVIPRPEELVDHELWKKTANNFQPKPRVVAYGLDKRNGRRLNLVAAYDGDRVGAGRIVADSTWHHYFNVNLENFRHGADRPFSPGDQIGQFYANLALWLTPLGKRYEMADAMVRWLEQHPAVLEEVGPVPPQRLADLMSTGDLARRLLSQESSPCEIHELLQVLVDDAYRERYESLYLPERGFTLSSLPSKELMLGSVVHGAREEPTEAAVAGFAVSDEARVTSRRNALAAASALAFEWQKLKVEETAKSAQRVFAEANSSNASNLAGGTETETELEVSPSRQASERSSIMAACREGDWEMTLTLDKNNVSETIGFREIRITAGVITGKVFDEPGQELGDLTGTCVPSTVTGEPNVSIMTFVFVVRERRGNLIGIFMTGIAFPVNAQTHRFLGTFRAFAPPTAPPIIATGQLDELEIDPGDTGTGNGQQT